MPQISVIVPVYKVEKYINRCVDSILAQTFTDFELILVDDGSPDNCGEICDEYAAKDSRIHVIHQKNGGLSAARNAGIDWAFANSDSEWLFFVDSDDWIHPKSLEVLMNGFVSTKQSIIIGGYEETEGATPFVNTMQLTPQIWDVKEYFDQYYINANVAWGKLYSMKLFRNLRFPVGRVHEDEFTTYKALFQCKTVAVIQQPLYAYYRNTAGITKSGWNISRLDAFLAFDKRAEYFKEHNDEEMYKKTISFLLDYILWNRYELGKSPFKEEKNIKTVDKMYVKYYIKYFSVLEDNIRKKCLLKYFEVRCPRIISIYTQMKKAIR